MAASHLESAWRVPDHKMEDWEHALRKARIRASRADPRQKVDHSADPPAPFRVFSAPAATAKGSAATGAPRGGDARDGATDAAAPRLVPPALPAILGFTGKTLGTYW